MEAVKPRKKNRKKKTTTNSESVKTEEDSRSNQGASSDVEAVEEQLHEQQGIASSIVPPTHEEVEQNVEIPEDKEVLHSVFGERTVNISTDLIKEQSEVLEPEEIHVSESTEGEEITPKSEDVDFRAQNSTIDINKSNEDLSNNEKENTPVGDQWEGLPAPVRQDENEGKESNGITSIEPVHKNEEMTEEIHPMSREEAATIKDQAYKETEIKDRITAEEVLVKDLVKDLRKEKERQYIEQEKSTERRIYPKLKSLEVNVKKCTKEKNLLKPFTEDELKIFYFNPLLEQLQGFTDRFLFIAKQDKHELYELVNTYFRSRNAVSTAMEEFKIVEKECDGKKEHLWITKDLTVTAEGRCRDNVKVTHNEHYHQIELHSGVLDEITNLLKTLRKALHETLCLQMYTCQVACLRVNVYLYEMINSSPILSKAFTEAHVGGQSPHEITSEFQAEVQNVRDCISVLFMFVRQPLHDQEFADNLHLWIKHLVSILLRVASLADLVFLVNHVMRCPPGFSSKVANFIQFPIPHYHGDMQVVGEQYLWDNPLVHHFVAMLAAILLPVRGREQFLERMTARISGAMRSISWTLIEEDDEEDENPENSWMLFQESDLVDVFGQFPFDAFFKHLFKMDPYLDGNYLTEGLYCIEKSSSRDIMRMLAFASCIVNIMGATFGTYQNLRYRGFVKRVGRTIRQVVQYVLDHWSNYRSWRVDMCRDSYTTLPDIYSLEEQFSIQRLQTEVDQFFMRATQQIICAHNLGAWQFLAGMPFKSVSSQTLWVLFWALHTDLKQVIPVLTQNGQHETEQEKGEQEWRKRLKELRSEFTDQLAVMSQSEAFFLLTTFANMATSRESHEKDYIEAVTLEVFEVSFISEQTREFCSKTGRDLLGTIAGFHPFVFTVLLQRVAESIQIIGKAGVYMFNGLPIYLCHPCSFDMDIVRGWLLTGDLSSPEHQLARYILQNMNWSCSGEQGESDRLFLHQSWHRAVAVMLVEASALRLPNRPGGISHEAFKEGGGLLQQVTSIAASSYSRLMQQNHEQVFADWLWDMVILLRLHEYDLLTPVRGFRSRSQAMPKREVSEGDTGFAGRTKALSSDEPLDLHTDTTLVNIVNAIKASGPLACYVAITMTITGANPDLFISNGLDQLSIILNEKCFDAVLRIMYNVVPLFFSCPDKLVEDKRFSKILHRLCQLDGESAYYAEKLLLYPSAGEYSGRIAGIIQSHIDRSHFRRNLPAALSVVEFWMKALCSLPNWYKDGCIQYLLDKLVEASFNIDGGVSAVQAQLIDSYRTVLKDTGSQSLIASFLSLVSLSSTGPPQLWDIKPSPDYSYYAYCVLSMEDLMETNSGLRVELSKVLIENQDINIDYALKKVAKVMKLASTPLSSHLSIYRWANQSINTAMDHPLLPLIWQSFFRLYLLRPSSNLGVPHRAGVGYRFFESQADVSLQKKMKQRLQTIAEHHRSMTSQTRVDQDLVGEGGDQEIDKQFEETKVFHEKLSLFYEVLALWLDEPRLHDPNLYLPSLPPLYDPQRLESVLKENQEPWLDLIHIRKIEWELTETVGKWIKHVYGNKRTSAMSRHNSSTLPDTASGRIIKRMRTHQPSLPPPPVVMLESPLPPLDDKFLKNKQKVINTVFDCLQKLLAHAKQFCRDTDHHMALDQDYLDLIPRCSTNEMTRLVKKVPCRSKFRSNDVCSGPATITLQYMARYDNQVVGNRIQENREEYNTMVKEFFQACPMDICSSAAYVERIIACLVKKAQVTQERNGKELLTDVGTSLFYQLAGAVNETSIRFQPTIQFFSSCIEILGKEFILNNGDQTEQLLSAILGHTSITMLLVPYFCPIDNPDRFTAMYRDVMQIPDRDLAFSLLTKFDLEMWLSSPNSSLIERSGLTAAVFTALKSLGVEPEPETKAINEVYLRHMSLVLMYNFPEQYSVSLQNLCEGSSTRSLSLDVWEKFLFCIGCVPVQQGGQPTQTPTHAPILADEQVMETLDWLTKYYADQRAELGGHVTGGLYTLWRPYIKQLSFLLGFMCQQIVVRSARRSTDGMERFWKLICDAFQPWICSQDNPVQGDPPVAPWNDTEVPQASDMVALFSDTISCLHAHFSNDHSGSSLMNLFWEFFVTSLVKPGIPDYVRRVYHSKFFSLPWNHFFPTPSNMDLMLQLFPPEHSTADALAVSGSTTSLNLHITCKTSFQFLGCVFPIIEWNDVIAAYCESQTPQALARFLTSLFHLLIMLTNEKSVVEVQGSELPTFLEKAHFYPWGHIDSSSFDQIVRWEVEHCNAELILQRNSSIWHAVRLIRAAAGILITESGTMQATQPDDLPKRASYIRSIVSLLVKCSSNQNLAPGLYPPVVLFILTDVESIAGSGVDPSSTESEVCLLLSETLSILNNCSPANHVTSHVLNFILGYLRSTTSLIFILASIPASCRALANLSFMVSVLETGIEEVFARHSPHAEETGVLSGGGWSEIVRVFSVPELSQDSFINECLHQSCLLTLYTYVQLRLSQCQSAVQEMLVLKDLVIWCGGFNIKKENEYKISLFWHKILQLSLRQADFSGSPLNEVAKQLSFLATNLHPLGEDKDSSGLLGAIGFGKKSSYSVNFRFFARVLETFVLAQLPSNALLRLEPKTPGYVREPSRNKQRNESGRVISATNEAELALSTLEALRQNKHYSSVSGHIMDTFSFIANPLHSLRDGPSLISRLAVDLYPGHSALRIMN